MNNTSSFLLLFFSVFASYLTAAPATIHYQGLLSDTSGTALANTSHTISINLYATEQDVAILYTQSFPDVVSDENGMYSIEIGDADLVSILEGNDSLWLELIINNETLAPRQAIHSVPYALHAESANRLVNADNSSISGDLLVSGNTSLSGNVDVNDSLNVSGLSTFNNDIAVGGRIMANRLELMGDLFMEMGTADFGMSNGVRVPTPDQPNEATNKAYVDNADFIERAERQVADEHLSEQVDIESEVRHMEDASLRERIDIEIDTERGERVDAETSLQNALAVETAAREAGDAAMPFKEPVLVATSGYNISMLNVQYSNPDGSGSYLNAPIGSRVLLTGRSNASENGIYTIGAVNTSGTHATSLVRALDYDSADEIGSGDMVYVREGQYAGQAYVLSSSTDNFEFGVDALDFNRFTVDPTQPVYFEDGLGANRLSANRLELMGDLFMEMGTADFGMSNGVRVPTPDQPNEATNRGYVDNADLTLQESIAINRVISDVSIADEASARINAISGITSGDTAFTGSPVFSAVNYSLWTDVSNHINGNVEASNVPSLSTVDVGGLLNAEVLNAEKLLRVGSTEITYDSGVRTSSIEINNGYETTRFDGMMNQISGEELVIDSMMGTSILGHLYINNDLEVGGYRADFSYVDEVIVPTPDQANEATNKAYVDSVVVPSGGLIAWPAANPIPAGWSNPGLTAPMTNYIWIQKN